MFPPGFPLSLLVIIIIIRFPPGFPHGHGEPPNIPPHGLPFLPPLGLPLPPGNDKVPPLFPGMIDPRPLYMQVILQTSKFCRFAMTLFENYETIASLN